MIQQTRRVLVILLALFIFTPQLSPTSAQAASITVNPVWRPGSQLVSIAGDVRSVVAEMWVTSNVQFWVAQFACTVNGTALHSAPNLVYNPSIWGQGGVNFTGVATPYTAGKTTFVASRLQGSSPIGSNGIMQTMLLVSLNFQLPLDVTTSATSPLTCTALFLDRNGKPVATPIVKAPAPLQIVTGYTLKGKVTYSGRANSAGITVSCVASNGGPVISGITSATGSFTIAGIRNTGTYQCLDESGLLINLSGITYVNLSTQGYTVPPVALYAGDVNNDFQINASDLGIVAANFGNIHMSAAQGDLNGDGRVDASDLALIASSYQEQFDPLLEHLLIGVSRNPSVLNNSRIWLGTITSSAVIPFGGSATAKAYSPVLSPDGTTIAYIQEVAAGTFDPITGFVTKLPRYALFVGAAGGTSGKQITPANWNYDAFTPAWSLDGRKIAFSCGTSNGNPVTAQWTKTGGNGIIGVCVIDATGSNLAVVASSVGQIRRPAWVSNTQFVVKDDNQNKLIQYDLSKGSSTALVNVNNCCGSAGPVYGAGQLFYEETGGAIDVTNYSFYGLDPTAVPPYTTNFVAPVTPIAFNTYVGTVSGATDTIIPFQTFCGFDAGPAQADLVLDNCDGSYSHFIKQGTNPNEVGWIPGGTQATQFIDGAVAPTVINAADPYGIWARAVAGSVNLVP